MKKVAICIIGLGPRGLGVMERCFAFARTAPAQDISLEVHVVEPGTPGVGTHRPDQPDYLLLNTICGLPTMFPGDLEADPKLNLRGPSLYEWVKREGYRLASDGYSLTKGVGREIEPTDYLPRRVLGEYLHWFYHLMVAAVPPNVRLRLHAQKALGLGEAEGAAHVVLLEDGTTLACDYLFLTTGHTANVYRVAGLPPAAAGRLVTNVYPTRERLRGVAAGQRVGISGFGLTAMDIVGEFTRGRGGRFTRAADGVCTYTPSGAEPHMVIYSRSGLAYRARPVGYAELPPYEPIFFTRQAVDELHAGRPRRSGLDFYKDLMPLLETEVRLAYYLKVGELLDGRSVSATVDGFGSGAARGRAASRWLEGMSEKHGDFDAAAAMRPPLPGWFEDGAGYQEFVAELISADLRAAYQGLTGNPLKFALEMLLHLREVVRHAVDFHGLKAESHERFAAEFVPAVNRNAIGPQLERNEELLALMKAGLVELPLGPAPEIFWDETRARWIGRSTRLRRQTEVELDWVCCAFSEEPSIIETSSVLLDSLHGSGRLRPCRPGSKYIKAPELSPGFNPITADGQCLATLYVLGPLCEGNTYYNHYIPTNLGVSPAFAEAHQTVGAMFADIMRSPRSVDAARTRA